MSGSRSTLLDITLYKTHLNIKSIVIDFHLVYLTIRMEEERATDDLKKISPEERRLEYKRRCSVTIRP